MQNWEPVVEVAARVAAISHSANEEIRQAMEADRLDVMARLTAVEATIIRTIGPVANPLQCRECDHSVTRPADLRAGLCKTCHSRISKRRERARRAAKTAAND